MVDQVTPATLSEPPTRISRRVKLILAAGVAIVIVAILVWFVHYQTRGQYLAGTNDAYVRADLVTVSPKVAGYVDQVYVKDNQDAAAGQPLVRIDARDYNAQAAQSKAQIEVAQANVDNVRAGIREQEAAGPIPPRQPETKAISRI